MTLVSAWQFEFFFDSPKTEATLKISFDGWFEVGTIVDEHQQMLEESGMIALPRGRKQIDGSDSFMNVVRLQIHKLIKLLILNVGRMLFEVN